MAAALPKLPLFVVLMGVGAALMLIPAFHALEAADYPTARVFLYGAIIGGVMTLLIGLATRGRTPANAARGQLLTIFAAFGLLPLLLALPFQEAAPGASLRDAWFEMVSAMTTTGATLWDNPRRLNISLHLWRGIVGWYGGFLTWLVAIAILAPMNLGGFEVRAAGQGLPAGARMLRAAGQGDLIWRHALRLLPIYAGLTALLWFGLILAGDGATVALIHAMAVISTSGITPVGGLQYAAAGYPGEVVMFVFFAFALSRLSFARGQTAGARHFWADGEFRLGIVIILAVSAALVLRHAVASTGSSFGEAIRALWAILFTVTSFLTTTGFESRGWFAAMLWSGIEAPGLLLLGLALIGGGVATTAGGVKLMRLLALLLHGEREVERLIHPTSVGGAGTEARRIRREGATIAWVFFMLFALSIGGIMLLLSLTGVQFETALILTVAAITNTGPLASVASVAPVSWDGLPDAARAILAAAMVLGRLETLALVALLNPDFWRN